MNDNPTEDQAAGQDNDQAGSTNRPILTRSRPRTALYTLLLAVTLTLAGGGFYLAYSNRDAGLSTDVTVQGLQGTAVTLAARIEGLESQLDELRERQEATSKSVQDIVSALPGSNEDWALMEVEFLLIIATHHLELERDIDTALRALRAAELRLRGLGGDALDPVREQLAVDIRGLSELNTADIRDLALFLGDLANHVTTLPLAGATGADSGRHAEFSDTQAAKSTGMLDTLWRELRNFVVIRQDEKKQRALLPPDEEYFVYQNLRLELENARLSLLRRDAGIAQAAMTSLQNWLVEYFDTRDPAVINVMNALQRISSLDLDAPLPDISSSLESLRAYIREQDELSPQDADSLGART